MKTALLAVALAFLAGEESEPPAPYFLSFGEEDTVDAPALRAALGKVEGVASVEVDAERRWAKVSAKDGALLPERHLRAAAESQSLEVTTYREPDWARMAVYDVEIMGGG